MTPLKTHTDKHASLAQASRALNIHSTQLKRWLDNNALVDSDGNVYIKTKGVINALSSD